MVEPVAFGEAAALISAVRSGAAGAESTPDPPVIVVDLDEGRDPVGSEPLRPPVFWPCVVIAIGNGVQQPRAGADVYLTALRSPARPWVAALDDLSMITAAVAANPQAATTLAQVLRSHTGDVGRDLLTESAAYSTLQAGAEHRGWLATKPTHAPDPDDSPPVRTNRCDDRLEIVLHRPARRNAYSAAMRDGLVSALELAANDPAIAHVDLRGDGPSFCSGGDLAEFGTVSDPATAHQIRSARSAAHHIHVIADKVTAHTHGACVGAGVELASFAGEVIAAPGSTFRLPEVGMGLIPGAGGTAGIPRRIGTHRTAWFALSGADLDVRTALQWGLVDEIADRT